MKAAGIAAASIASAVVLYILSTGPVVRVQLSHGVRGDLLPPIYRPVAVLAIHCKPFGDVWQWYLNVWIRK